MVRPCRCLLHIRLLYCHGPELGRGIVVLPQMRLIERNAGLEPAT
jgi:hypothetical protein